VPGEEDRFLKLLSSDPEQARCEYIALRRKLVFYFRNNGVSDPENLADQSLMIAYDHVLKGQEITTTIGGFCYGIARNVLSDHRRRKSTQEMQPEVVPEASFDSWKQIEARITLEQCLSALSPDERRLLVQYFTQDREALASRMGMTAAAMRVKIHRIRQKVERPR
jgi:RNA polymerase sigma factor (sigma-70 family)